MDQLVENKMKNHGRDSLLLLKFSTLKETIFIKPKEKSKRKSFVKQEIVEKAEALADSTDWKNTANTLKKLQNDWKESGMAPKKEADLLWNRLKNACNNFFNNLKEQHKAQDKEFEENFKLKENFLKEVKAFKNSGDTKKDVEQIKVLLIAGKSLKKYLVKTLKQLKGLFAN